MSQDIRTKLHSAFAFVRGVEVNKATAALTLDHIIQEQINTLKKGELRAVRDGQGTAIDQRPSRWDQLDALGKDIASVVQTISDANDDPDILKHLGIFEADKESTSDDAPSANVAGF